MLKHSSLEDFIDYCRVNDNKKIILFGASKMGETILKILKKNNINVHLIFDNDINKQNKKLNDINICCPHKNEVSNYIILIASMYFNEIYSQLSELNYLEDLYYIDNLINRYNYLLDLIEKHGCFLDVHNSSMFDRNFKFSFDELDDGIHLRVGKDSLINCNIIFQKNTGLVQIGDRSYITEGTELICIDNISIGNDVLISWGCTIYDNDSHSIDWELRKNDVINMIESLKATGKLNGNKNWNNINHKPIIIQDKVWIGFGVTILKGVTIGEGSIVAAKSVVTRDVPPNTLVAGNPAKTIRKLD